MYYVMLDKGIFLNGSETNSHIPPHLSIIFITPAISRSISGRIFVLYLLVSAVSSAFLISGTRSLLAETILFSA